MTGALARRIAFALLSRIHGGRIELVEATRSFVFGDPRATLQARVTIHDPRAYAAALRGSAGLGESYAAGWWSSDDLVAVIRIACRNMATIDRLRGRLQPLLAPVQRLLSRVPLNTRPGAQRHISAHYDLGNDLFESFLDSRLIYSCGIFPSPEATLDEAQLTKLERICEQLELGPEDHLLEVGCGWGGLAIHAAATRGCRVTATTISREQRERAETAVREEGLTERVEILFRDYRDLDGQYDRLVSIEMIEAVGWQFLPQYFATCKRLLRPGGRMLLQAIVIDDRLYEQEKAGRSFFNTHVFPGGCLPSQSVIAELAAAHGLRIEASDEITDHYVLTLAAWRRRFAEAWPRLRELGYDERFRRLWDFYLAASEAGFSERRIRDLQIVLTRPGAQADPQTAWTSGSTDKARASLSS